MARARCEASRRLTCVLNSASCPGASVRPCCAVENHELQTQAKFLEDEVALLRRRLSNAPRQVKVLEEQILQTRSDLMRAATQNEKLVSALKSEREKIEALKEEVEKLTQPPAT